MKAIPTGMDTRLSRAIRQSSTNRVDEDANRPQHVGGHLRQQVGQGPLMLSTWSTMTCFIWPLEVSRMVPRGILGSFSKIFSRMDFKIEKVACGKWDRARE